MPLLMIWGKNDVVAYPSPTARAARCKVVRPDVTIAMIPGAGHWVPYESPEAINAALLNFLCR